MEPPSKSAIVVGGSLAGLMSGIVLKHQGYSVKILEQSDSSTRVGHAAGIIAGPKVLEFMAEYDRCGGSWCLPGDGVQVFNRDLKPKRYIKMPLQMTSWEEVYYRLRANFDGLESKHCPQPHPEAPSRGSVEYFLGQRVTDIVPTNSGASVSTTSTHTPSKPPLSASLVILASGANSCLRAQLQPSTPHPRRYSGYIAWRGTVPEHKLPVSTRALFSRKLNFYEPGYGYIVIYFIPDPSPGADPGARLLNLLWYQPCPADSTFFASAMTDASGHQHRSTLPAGKMRREVWAVQCETARRSFAPEIAAIVEIIEEPYISTVADSCAGKAVLGGGRVLVVGDALALFRPHVGRSTNQAAANALGLREVLGGEKGLGEWEGEAVRYARVSMMLSRVLGAWYLEGYWSFLRNVVGFLRAWVGI